MKHHHLTIPPEHRPFLVRGLVTLLFSAVIWFFAFDKATHSHIVEISSIPTMLIAREIITPLGKTDTQLMLLIVIWLLGFLKKSSRVVRAVKDATLAMICSGLVATLLKLAIPRARPFVPNHYQSDIASAYYQSFPSSDAATLIAMAATLGVWYPRLRWPLIFAAMSIPVMRVLRLAHWPSDAIAGAAVGFIGCFIVMTLKYANKRQISNTPSPQQMPSGYPG